MNLRHRYFLLVLALVPGLAAAQAIPLFGLFEQALTNDNRYDNPFTDVELVVHYTAPSGRKITFPGFYDGDGNGGQDGKVWKFRFMPDEPGEWRYTYQWSDNTRGGSGSFESTAEGALPGPWQVNPDNPYWLTDSHGKHFLPLSFFANGVFTPLDWQDAITWAEANGYNTIVTPTMNTYNWGDGWVNTTAFTKDYGPAEASACGILKRVDYDRYNLRMWREWDDMLRTAGSKGIYIGTFEGPSGKYGGRYGRYPPTELVFYPGMRDRFDTERNVRFMKYYIARQGAFWNLAFWNIGSTEAYYYAVEDEDEFQDYFSYLDTLTPWYRMITAQDCEQWHTVERRWLSSSPVADARKLNTLQTAVSSKTHPHWGADDIDNPYWQEARPNNELALDSFAGFPMLCTECLWEGQGRAEQPVRIIWGMLTAGAFTMWADWKATSEKRGSLGRGWIPIKPLDERVLDPRLLGENTVGDEQLKYATEKLATLEFWKMKPYNELVTGDPEAYCLAEPGEQYVVYLPKGGVARLELPAGSFVSSWFNPHNGVTLDSKISEGGDMLVFQSPDDNDWVLVITKN